MYGVVLFMSLKNKKIKNKKLGDDIKKVHDWLLNCSSLATERCSQWRLPLRLSLRPKENHEVKLNTTYTGFCESC